MAFCLACGHFRVLVLLSSFRRHGQRSPNAPQRQCLGDHYRRRHSWNSLPEAYGGERTGKPIPNVSSSKIIRFEGLMCFVRARRFAVFLGVDLAPRSTDWSVELCR